MFDKDKAIRIKALISTPLLFTDALRLTSSVHRSTINFRDLHEIVILHQCSTDNIFSAVVSYWINTKDEGRLKVTLMEVFQSPLAPEELALTLRSCLSSGAMILSSVNRTNFNHYRQICKALRNSYPGSIPWKKMRI